MAKTPRAGGKVITKTIGQSRGKRPEFPLTSGESNEAADQQARILHYSLLAACLLLTLGGVGWGVSELYTGTTSHPIHILAVILGIIALVASFFVGRSMVWLSIIAPAMSAAKNKGWKGQEELCRKGLKLARIFPDNTVTLALILVQSLLSRGELDEAIAIAEEQDKLLGDKTRFQEALGPLYSTLAMAQQAKGNLKQSITWSDRAIDSFQKTLDKYASKKKGWLTKLAEAQGGDIVGNLKTQLTVAYFNNATGHFNTMNYRVAKANFQKAVETAAQAPEFPEKADIVKASRDALSRLKHT